MLIRITVFDDNDGKQLNQALECRVHDLWEAANFLRRMARRFYKIVAPLKKM